MQHIPSPLPWVGTDTQGAGKGYHGGWPPPQRIIQGSVVGAAGFPGACSHHFSHLEAQFLMRCCQHGQGPRSRILHLVIILATKQHHQLQPVVAISQEPLLYL